MRRIKLIAFGVLAVAGVAWCVTAAARRAEAVQPAAPDTPVAAVEKMWKDKGFTYQEASKCMECHTIPSKTKAEDDKALDVCLLTEYAVWRTNDKHAQAYAVLVGDRGKKIGDVLKIKDVTDPKAGCMSCHAMHNLSAINLEIGKNAPMKVEGIDKQDGVSCGGCHGPSSAWLGLHDKKAWRDKTQPQKQEQGMRDLRDPVIRAELCMSCHIGNAREGKVVTHAMMAAGHPPLPPIEISTFSQNEPQHWRDFKDMPLLKDQKNNQFARTRFAVIGNVVAVRETLRLVRDRTNFSQPKSEYVFPELAFGEAAGTAETQARVRWPEIAMAHSDCFACHHDLKYPGFRQKRGFGYSVPGLADAHVTPGRPMIRSWPLGVLKVGVDVVEKKPNGLADRLSKLAVATKGRPFGDPDALQGAAGDLVKWCDELIAELQKTDFDRDRTINILRSLCTLFDESVNKTGVPDYETARQVASIALIAAEDLGIKDADDVIAKLDSTLNLKPYLLHRKDRVGILLHVVREAAKSGGLLPDNQLAAFNDGAKQFSDYLKNVGDVDMVKKMYINQFLVVVKQGISNKDFTTALTKGKIDGESIADKLQGFGDDEQKQVLRAIADYKPEEFRANMKRLGEIAAKLK